MDESFLLPVQAQRTATHNTNSVTWCPTNATADAKEEPLEIVSIVDRNRDVERCGAVEACCSLGMSSSSAAAAAGSSRKRARGAEESDEAKLARTAPFNEHHAEHALELASGNLSDVTLRVGAAGATKTTDLPFARYPLVIQSPGFSSMLLGGMAESRGDAPVRV